MDLSPNAQRFSGTNFVELYDRYRPEPPAIILEHAKRYAAIERPQLVIDLGCGTGLSTTAWLNHTARVVGVEPSEAMLDIARRKVSGLEDRIAFIAAFSDKLPFAEGEADIICCSQSFHWMEPTSTLREVERVLRPGGVLVVYDCAWPPTIALPLEQAYRQLFQKVKQLTAESGQVKAVHFPKHRHLENIGESGHFSFVKEVHYHQEVPGGVDRLVGIARSQGGLEALFKLGYSEQETGWSDFMEAIETFGGDRQATLTFHYTVIYGVK